MSQYSHLVDGTVVWVKTVTDGLLLDKTVFGRSIASSPALMLFKVSNEFFKLVDGDLLTCNKISLKCVSSLVSVWKGKFWELKIT